MKQLNKLFLLLNCIVIIALLLSYLALFLKPETLWIVAFFGLIYPIVLIINILFIVYWAIQFKPQAFLSFIVIICGWNILIRGIQLNFKNQLSTDELKNASLIKVMSYNVRLFNLYNWTKNKKTRDELLNFIKHEKPDIISFQEFYADDNNKFISVDTLKKILQLPYVNTCYIATLRKTDHWGIATFSKFPIINTGTVIFNKKSTNSCIYSDIVVNFDTIRVYNAHLQSIQFNKEDYKFISKLENNEDVEEIDGSKKILRRMKRAYVKRSSQADSIHASINRSPYPVIVCGDFNDSPSSYTYQTISKNLNDAFMESGNGLGRTYIGDLPSLRIDYLLFSPILRSYNFTTFQDTYSDHRPVSCYTRLVR